MGKSKRTRLGGKKGGQTKRRAPAGYAEASRRATSAQESSRSRIAAFTRLGGMVCDDLEVFKKTLATLRDASEPLGVREAALASLQAASFSSPNFAACRPAYMAGLRALVKDKEPEIRQRVLGILSRENDGHAQEVLLEGLQSPDKAQVPPEKALQLLGYDPKSVSYPVARRIAQNPPNPDARKEALRLLAADSQSTQLFESLLLNKEEPVDVRQIAAVALNALAPEALQRHARTIVLDNAEKPALQAASLAALANFGKEAAVANDTALTDRVAHLGKSSRSKAVKAGVSFFKRKYKV